MIGVGVNRRWKRVLAAAAILALAVGLFYLLNPRSAQPPAIPAEVTDLSVSAAISKARDDVLANPQSGSAWGELGLVFRAHDYIEESLVCFVEAARLEPAKPTWPYLIGLGLLEPKPNEAVPYFETAYQIAAAPDEKSAARLRLAELYLDRGRTDEAIALFNEELQRDPSNVRAHYWLGARALQMDNPAAAVEHLTITAAGPFGRKNASALLANAYRRLGKDVDANRAAADSAGHVGPLFWPDPFVMAYMGRGTGRSTMVQQASSSFNAGQQGEALSILEKMAAIYPDIQTLTVYGDALSQSGQPSQAEEVLRRAVKLDPNYSGAHHLLGVVLFQQGEAEDREKQPARAQERFQLARGEFLKTVALKPGHAAAFLYLAKVQRRLGQLPEAIVACREATRLSPSLVEAHLVLGEVLLELKRPQEAIAPLEQAVRLSPPDFAPPKAALERARTEAMVKK